MARSQSNPTERAAEIFRRRGGMMRTSQALRDGIHRRTLYAMRDSGRLEQVTRGLYRLADAAPLSNPDLITVAARVPSGVICLISALAFHEITTQIPHKVHLALPRTARTPTLKHPPLRVFRFSGRSLTEGIEHHDLDGETVRIFGPEKTIADCFKFRNKIGLDVAIEALRMYSRTRRVNASVLLHFTEIDRVAVVIRPYLEALL